MKALTFTAWGLRIGVTAADPAPLEAVRSRLPPGLRVHRRAGAPVGRLYSFAGRRAVTVEVDGRALGGGSLRQAIELWRADLRRHLAEHARGGLFVHAGLVAWRGRALLVPGRSRSGKTTLVSALARAGARPLDDEYAVLDRSGRARGSGLTFEHRRSDQRRRASGPDPRPLPVALVVLTRHRPGGRWRPRRLSGGRALLAVLPHVVAARRRPAAALSRLRAGLATATVLSGPRGEARDTARAVLAALAALSPIRRVHQ